MHSIRLVLGLMVGVVTSKTFKYTLPSSVEATADCTLPGEFEISDFKVYTDFVDNTKNTTSFHYSDVDTGVDTSCQQNSTSKSTNTGAAQRWPCDDANVEFIYQTTTTGVSGLTLIEKACLESSTSLEASGLVKPDLICTNTTSSSTCTGKQSPLPGDFTSISPAPPQ
ncbi:hypothetical protein MGN70_005344 [Eutypa lata]|uniref:AA1-like domain-containing protein n=1 Tax=Eutypa lata (strain UCR-EL1) TaxID=1287681 RepID=M7SWX4_EUTLA|nr:hypothetical protein UCREL1_11015 [Eutypa lata UCREL1]KAI1253136.1 hypothetical protein MGN70_005344 [Eutypa lata]